jgi:hypothetical protein
MLCSLSLSFLYQRDKEAVLLWITGIIPLKSNTAWPMNRQVLSLFFLASAQI